MSSKFVMKKEIKEEPQDPEEFVNQTRMLMEEDFKEDCTGADNSKVLSGDTESQEKLKIFFLKEEKSEDCVDDRTVGDKSFRLLDGVNRDEHAGSTCILEEKVGRTKRDDSKQLLEDSESQEKVKIFFLKEEEVEVFVDNRKVEEKSSKLLDEVNRGNHDGSIVGEHSDVLAEKHTDVKEIKTQPLDEEDYQTYTLVVKEEPSDSDPSNLWTTEQSSKTTGLYQ